MNSPIEGGPVEGLALESRHCGRHSAVGARRGGGLLEERWQTSRGRSYQISAGTECKGNRDQGAAGARGCEQLAAQQEERRSAGSHES